MHDTLLFWTFEEQTNHNSFLKQLRFNCILQSIVLVMTCKTKNGKNYKNVSAWQPKTNIMALFKKITKKKLLEQIIKVSMDGKVIYRYFFFK